MLTFDDGPDERYTNNLLDVLKENQITATFFVVAENAKNNPDIIHRMHDGRPHYSTTLFRASKCSIL